MNRWDGYDGELYHHGILGQKWGIRRYQNEDGSLTEEGRQRYGYGSSNKQRQEGGSIARKGLTSYSKDTWEKVDRDIRNHDEFKKAVLKSAGVRTALYLGGGAVSALTGFGPLGFGMMVAGSMAGSAIENKGREKVAKALNYKNLADMQISKYDAYAKKAGMPGAMKTIELLYGKDSDSYREAKEALKG